MHSRKFLFEFIYERKCKAVWYFVSCPLHIHPDLSLIKIEKLIILMYFFVHRTSIFRKNTWDFLNSDMSCNSASETIRHFNNFCHSSLLFRIPLGFLTCSYVIFSLLTSILFSFYKNFFSYIITKKILDKKSRLGYFS